MREGLYTTAILILLLMSMIGFSQLNTSSQETPKIAIIGENTGSLSGNGDFTWFVFNADPDQSYLIKLEGPTNTDFDLLIEDDEGNFVNQLIQVGYYHETVISGQAKYYMKVSSYYGQGEFELLIYELKVGDLPSLRYQVGVGDTYFHSSNYSNNKIFLSFVGSEKGYMYNISVLPLSSNSTVQLNILEFDVVHVASNSTQDGDINGGTLLWEGQNRPIRMSITFEHALGNAVEFILRIEKNTTPGISSAIPLVMNKDQNLTSTTGYTQTYIQLNVQPNQSYLLNIEFNPEIMGVSVQPAIDVYAYPYQYFEQNNNIEYFFTSLSDEMLFQIKTITSTKTKLNINLEEVNYEEYSSINNAKSIELGDFNDKLSYQTQRHWYSLSTQKQKFYKLDFDTSQIKTIIVNEERDEWIYEDGFYGTGNNVYIGIGGTLEFQFTLTEKEEPEKQYLWDYSDLLEQGDYFAWEITDTENGIANSQNGDKIEIDVVTEDVRLGEYVLGFPFEVKYNGYEDDEFGYYFSVLLLPERIIAEDKVFEGDEIIEFIRGEEFNITRTNQRLFLTEYSEFHEKVLTIRNITHVYDLSLGHLISYINMYHFGNTTRNFEINLVERDTTFVDTGVKIFKILGRNLFSIPELIIVVTAIIPILRRKKLLKRFDMG